MSSAAVATAPREFVLILEDDEGIAQLLGIYLAKLGLGTRWAQLGQQALAVFAEHRDCIRLVVADCRLPDMDGREVCHRMRLVSPDLPVLLASGNVAIRTLAPLPPGPGVEFLAKPYSPAEFMARVRKLLIETTQVSPVAPAGFV